jgi:acetylornithine deacetylase/succinyl-diaminopimelate desuccinylase-like protein
METQNITQLISQLTVPSSDDGKKFIRTDRLDLITQALRDSNYNCLADLPLAKIYSHRDFQTDKPAILVSCHIDSVYEEYFARLQDGELHGTFDNSACNAVLVEAMLQALLPVQALVTFTGDEEKKSRGADRTIVFLQKIDVFQNLEMVISLDLTEEQFGSCHFTIENHCVEKKNKESLLKFSKKQDMVDYLSAMIDCPMFIKNAEPDESWT